MLQEEVKRLAMEVLPEIVDIRRQLHACPELSFEEYETSALIKCRLDRIGISWKEMAGTGIVATVSGELSLDRVIALRADIDALPIAESGELPYCSRKPGVMHACGHDAHAASLLGVANILQRLRGRFGGTVRLIFQPGEEKLPGGASLMIGEGVLRDPVPAAIIGQHVHPAIPTGKIAIRAGKFMASMDEIYMTVYGQGGHAAMPHRSIDPVMISGQILVALQQVVSRYSDPFLPSVLSFGKVIAAGSVNIIPDSVYLEGTFRTMDERWRDEAHGLIRKIACGVAEGLGGRCRLDISRGYPVLVNQGRLTADVTALAGEYLGPENVVRAEAWMAAEDFAAYSQVIDASFYLLGTGKAGKGSLASLHSSGFNIDEDALGIGAGLMTWIALRLLGNE